MNPEILNKALEWTTSEYDANTRHEIQHLIDTNNEAELIDRFWQTLEFGTGGLRGLRGAGSNRMNIPNIKKVTQGLANYILAQDGAQKGVVIGRDTRIFSSEFAQAAANVLVANGIKVYYFEEVTPTPVVSFTIRHTNAQAGIMNTASHNPKEYNGYKVFWSKGEQLTPPHDHNVMDEIKKITSLSQVKTLTFEETENNPLFQYCDEYKEKYLEMGQKLSLNHELCTHSNINILYSSLHGVGYHYVPELLKRFGFQHVHGVTEQLIPDGRFPTAPYPNPEDAEAMHLGLEQLKKINGDLFIATDPDADRIGVGYRTSEDNYELLNGNQIGALIFDYFLKYPMKANSAIITTIVTSPLIKKMAEKNNIEYAESLTGFRWIAEKTEELLKQKKDVFFEFEESHGYNISDDIRDKDGVTAACIFAELTAYHKAKSLCLDEVLILLAQKYGYYKETQVSLSFPGAEGANKMKNLMNKIRQDTPITIGTYKVLHTVDYLNENTGLPKSNVFAIFLENNVRIIARPSGTEPKIKFYFSTEHKIDCSKCVATADQNHAALKKEFLKIFQ